MPDLNFQEFSTVQSDIQYGAQSIVGVATIAPKSLLTKIVGGVAFATIVPPVSGDHLLFIMADAALVIPTSGNVLIGYTMVVGRPIGFLYDSKLGKYHVLTVA